MAVKKRSEQKITKEPSLEEEKLKAYKVAMDLATKFGQLASVEGTVPPAIAGMALGAAIGVMTDISRGRNTRNTTNKLKYFSRARGKIARCNEVISLMGACGWVDDEEYKQLKEDVVALSKMSWGLVKMLRGKVNSRKTVAEETGEEK